MGHMMIKYFSWICQKQKLFHEDWSPNLTFLYQSSRKLEPDGDLVITMMENEVGSWKLNGP